VTDHRSAARRAAALVVILGAASVSATLRHEAAQRAVSVPGATAAPPVVLPDTLAFDVEYAGIGAEGIDQIWRGTVAGPLPGRVTIRMEYAGAPADRRMPVWPVNVWLFFSANDDRSSFAAELSGSMNWATGDMRVRGLVSDGVRRAAAVEQRVWFGRPGLAGKTTVRFLDSTLHAQSRRWNNALSRSLRGRSLTLFGR